MLATFLATGLGLALYLLRFDDKLQLTNWRGIMVLVTLATSSLLILVIASRVGHLSALAVFVLVWPQIWKRSPRYALIALLMMVVALVAACQYALCRWWKRSGRVSESWVSSALLVYSARYDQAKALAWLGIWQL